MKLILAATLALSLAASSVGAVPLPGGDRDMHGCISSAGYTWSNIRQSCIRIFEDGIRLDPVASTGSTAVLSAFIVFAHGREGAAAELFTPRKSRPVILRRAGLRAWEGGGWRLTRDHGLFRLGRVNGPSLYQGAAAP